MLNSSAAKTHPRQASRPNSTSSSSVVTVQRAASLSSRGEPKNPHAKVRPSSPDDSVSISNSLPLNSRPPEQKHKKRASGGHSRPSSIGAVQEGVANLNRWSQSTTSSKNSIQGQSHHRNSSFSRRLSFGSPGSLGSLKSLANPQSPPTRNVLVKSRQSPGKSPQREQPPVASSQPFISTLPPIVTLPTLSQAVDAAASPSTNASATPTTAQLLAPSVYSGGGDYFGNKWGGRAAGAYRGTEARSPLALGDLSSQKPALPPSDVVEPQVSAKNGRVGSPSRDRSRQHQPAKSGDRTPQRGHSRNRAKGSAGTGTGSSTSSIRSDKERKHRSPSQKTMLSKALQKANTAVLLDNAQNFEGAMEAYSEACQLLEQVMLRSAGDEDRKKLAAIRTTYTNRVNELRTLDFTYHQAEGKALPERPMSNESVDQGTIIPLLSDDEHDAPIIETATTTRLVNSTYIPDPRQGRSLAPSQIPPRRQSLLPSAFDEEIRFDPPSPTIQSSPQRAWSRSPKPGYAPDRSKTLAPPMEAEYVPPPLSPRRPKAADWPEVQDSATGTGASALPGSSSSPKKQHSRETSNESTSWLDTIDESGGSSSSSIHSRSSSLRPRRKPIRPASGGTEAEFDAALDAAVEAAYDDGFEIADEDLNSTSQTDVVANARRNVELARQKVREAEREAELRTKAIGVGPPLQDATKSDLQESTDDDYLDDEAEEEERLLEEMTKGYVMDDFEFDLQSKSALPRKSDSSGFSGQTWGSSRGSNATTAGHTSLTTVAESSSLPSIPPKLPPPHPPPMAALPMPPLPKTVPSAAPPPPPSMPPPRPPSFGSSLGPGVRDRRLSGQNAKQLKIETNAKHSTTQGQKPQPPPKTAPNGSMSALRSESKTTPAAWSSRAAAQTTQHPTSAPTPPAKDIEAGAGELPPVLMLDNSISQDSDDRLPPIPASPARLLEKAMTAPDVLRKNVSLTNLKMRNLSVAQVDFADASPITPGSSTFPPTVEARKGVTATMPVLPTPTGATFTINGLPTGGLYLFENDIHSPTSPGSPNALVANAPAPLEPCPDSFLLRPFWLMRCLYQTVAHPRGGYVSTKLFIPKDVWRVKNVKLKAVDEKVTACDYLTAALLKLARVDTFDADAVLEEMQSLELVLDQVQVSLAKKLGNEVGVQSPANLFKGSPATEDAVPHAEMLSSKTANTPGKSYLTSWRKLRSKNSGAGLGTNFSSAIARDSSKDALSMSSLPMTSTPSARHAKRSPNLVQCTGPNANYMGALARLCDAVQVLGKYTSHLP